MTITLFVVAVSFIALFFTILFFTQHFMYIKELNKLMEECQLNAEIINRLRKDLKDKNTQYEKLVHTYNQLFDSYQQEREHYSLDKYDGNQ